MDSELKEDILTPLFEYLVDGDEEKYIESIYLLIKEGL